jgi:hypothetical protein
VSSIQQSYEHGLLELSVGQLSESSAYLAGLELDPVVNANTTNIFYTAEQVRLEAERLREQQLARETEYGSTQTRFGTVTIIGDSVVMGAAGALSAALEGAYIDVEGSRRMEQVYSLIEQLQTDGLLGEYVILGLATNVFVMDSPQGARYIAEHIPAGHRLIFITGYGHTGVQVLNETLWALESEYSYVTVADWYSIAAENPNMLSGDHTHIAGNDQAISLYTNCVIEAITRASTKPTS